MDDATEASLGTDPKKADSDGDGVNDNADNCPLTTNPDQANADGAMDGGDACDDDDDNDGVDDAAEDALGTDPKKADSDGDGISDDIDNCPKTANPDQANSDDDDLGDACDSGGGGGSGTGGTGGGAGDASGDDGDSIPDAIEARLLEWNNDLVDADGNPVAPGVANNFADSDGDGIPDPVEELILLTDEDSSDLVTCADSVDGGLTGQWDVRVTDSGGLANEPDFLTDEFTAVSVCHATDASDMPYVFHVTGPAFTTGWDGSTLLATWQDPYDPDAGVTTLTLDATDDSDVMVGVLIDDLGNELDVMATRRSVLSGDENVSGVIGAQAKFYNPGEDGGMGDVMSEPLNPVSLSAEVAVDGTRAILYQDDGGVSEGYYVPSRGLFYFAGQDAYDEDMDGDGTPESVNENMEIRFMLVEAPVDGNGGMFRGEADIMMGFEPSTSGEIYEVGMPVSLYGKYRSPSARVFHWNTPKGEKDVAALRNIPYSVSGITLSGPADSSVATPATVLDSSEEGLRVEDVVKLRNRWEPLTDGEGVGIHADGESILISQISVNLNDPTSTIAPEGEYRFSLSGGEGWDGTVFGFDHTHPDEALPLIPNDTVQYAQVTSSGASMSANSGAPTVVDVNSDLTLSWDYVAGTSVAPAVYDVRLIPVGGDSSWDGRVHVFRKAADICDDADRCSLTLPAGLFESGVSYRVNIRARGGADQADPEYFNRSTSGSFYIEGEGGLADPLAGSECSSDSEPEVMNTSVPCAAAYVEVATGRQDDNGVDVTMPYVLHVPSNENAQIKGIAVLIPGGDMDAKFTGTPGADPVASLSELTGASGNFLIRSAQMFADDGYLAVSISLPSDVPSQSSGSDNDPYRVSADHATDINAVLADVQAAARLVLQSSDNLPVFLIGTSRGAISAVAQARAVDAENDVAGIAIPSAVTSGGGSPLTASDAGSPTYVGLLAADADNGLDAIPVHYLVHEYDLCSKSSPSDADALQAAMAGLGVDVTYTTVNNGFTSANQSNPCKANTYHGFLGMENAAVDEITTWMDGVLQPPM